MKPCDKLLIVVSRFLLSSSSHVAEPFSAHCGHVTCVTNRSRFTIVASCRRSSTIAARTASGRTAISALAWRSEFLRLFAWNFARRWPAYFLCRMERLLTNNAIITGQSTRILLHGFTLPICQWGMADSRPQIWNNQRGTESSWHRFEVGAYHCPFLALHKKAATVPSDNKVSNIKTKLLFGCRNALCGFGPSFGGADCAGPSDLELFSPVFAHGHRNIFRSRIHSDVTGYACYENAIRNHFGTLDFAHKFPCSKRANSTPPHNVRHPQRSMASLWL